MNTDADRVAYGYVHSCDTLENRGEAPLPQLTPQLARWVARCSARAYALWGCKYGDAALAENTCEVIALAARFAVDGWLDEGWRQFSCFSIGQITGATGWDDDRARRALGACKLDMAPRLSRRGSQFCRELQTKKEAPFLAQIKMGRKGQSSTYRFVGIEPPLAPRDDDPNARPTSTAPKTMGGAEPGIGWCQRGDWVVPTAQLGGAKTRLGGAEGAIGWCDADDFTPPISDVLGGAQTTVMYVAQPISAAETLNSAVTAAPPYPATFGGDERMPAATPSSNPYIS